MAYVIQKYTLTKPLFFIGFMGSGKTDTAFRVGELCGIESLDTDKMLVQKYQKSISELLQENSVSDFRRLEAEILAEISEKKKIIATGGGCVESAVSRGLLQNGYCVYLTVSADEAYDRIKDFDNRPLLEDFESAQNLLEKRLSLYEQCADLIIDSSGKTVEKVAREVISKLTDENILRM